MGLTSGDSPELWNAEHPDLDREACIGRSSTTGDDIILTNSFGANRRRLMLHGLEARARELNRLATQNARKVADGLGDPSSSPGRSDRPAISSPRSGRLEKTRRPRSSSSRSRGCAKAARTSPGSKPCRRGRDPRGGLAAANPACRTRSPPVSIPPAAR